MKKLFSLLVTLFLLAAPMSANAKPLPSVSISSPMIIAGAFASGGTLRITYDDSDLAVSSSVEWFAAGVKIADQSARTLLLGSGQIGKVISAKLTLRKTGFKDTVFNLTGYSVAASLPTVQQYLDGSIQSVPIEPSCEDVVKAGFIPAVKIGWYVWENCQNFLNLSFGQPSFTYTWFREGTAIGAQNSNSYTLVAADAGKSIWVTSRGVYPNGFTAVEVKKLNQKVPNLLKVVKPTITGKLTAGAVLSAGTKGWETGVTFSYQWFRDYLPISGATSSRYLVQSADLGKAIQVMVSGQKTGFSPASAISAVFGDNASALAIPLAAYSNIYSNYAHTETNYSINYISSSNVTAASLAREKRLIQAAADFWIGEYTPNDVTVMYLTKDDATWAESVIEAHSGWSSHIPGGITSWITQYNCGFALAFKVDGKQVFVQCIRNGADSSNWDKQVTPHEYSHWVQYEQNSSLWISGINWLIEGQANFYGMALGMAPEDPDLRFVNLSIVNHSTMYDTNRGLPFEKLSLLDILQSGDAIDIQSMIDRSGWVFEKYAIGSLISEWLVAKYGHQNYVDWMKAMLHNVPANYSDAYAKNKSDFYEIFGFQYEDLGKVMAPYFEARSIQLRSIFLNREQYAVKPGSTVNTTQQLPVFVGTSASINSAQMDWMIRRLKDGLVTRVECNWRYLKTSSVIEKTRLALQATNACNWANSELRSYERTPVTTITSSLVTKSSDVGKVYMTFKN